MATAPLSGLSAFVVLEHTNAICSPPGIDGIVLEQREGHFRIDRDQKSKTTKNLECLRRANRRLGSTVFYPTMP